MGNTYSYFHTLLVRSKSNSKTRKYSITVRIEPVSTMAAAASSASTTASSVREMNTMLKSEGFVKIVASKNGNQQWECMAGHDDEDSACDAKGHKLANYIVHAKKKHGSIPRLMEIISSGPPSASEEAADKRQKTLDSWKVDDDPSSSVKTKAQFMMHAQAWLASSDQALSEFDKPLFRSLVNAAVSYGSNTNNTMIDLPSRYTVKRLLVNSSPSKSIMAKHLERSVSVHEASGKKSGVSLGADGVTVNGVTLQVLVMSSSSGHVLLDAHAMGAEQAGRVELHNLYVSTLNNTHKISSSFPALAKKLQAVATKYAVSMSSDNAAAAVGAILPLKSVGLICFGDPMHAMGRVLVHLVQKIPMFAQSVRDQEVIIHTFRGTKLFREALRQKTPLALFRFIETRFLFHQIAGQRLVRLFGFLKEVCAQDHVVDQARQLPKKQSKGALKTIDLVCTPSVRQNVSFMCAVMAPISFAIRTLDSGQRDICLVDPLWRSTFMALGETFANYPDVPIQVKKDILAILVADWKKYDYPVFGAAFALHPHSRSFLRNLRDSSEQEARREFISYQLDLQTTLTTFFCRFNFPAPEAMEVPRARTDATVTSLVQECMAEFSQMLDEEGDYAADRVFYSALDTLHVSSWWSSRILAGPLKFAATRITSITPGTGPTEKSHNERNIVHTPTMNRRSRHLVSDLVRTQMSLRQEARMPFSSSSPIARPKLAENGTIANLVSVIKSNAGEEALVNFAREIDNVKRRLSREPLLTTDEEDGGTATLAPSVVTELKQYNLNDDNNEKEGEDDNEEGEDEIGDDDTDNGEPPSENQPIFNTIAELNEHESDTGDVQDEKEDEPQLNSGGRSTRTWCAPSTLQQYVT
jgi:hypothetical protein